MYELEFYLKNRGALLAKFPGFIDYVDKNVMPLF